MTFPSLGEIVIFAKGKQSRKLKPLASLSRELPANPQLIQTESLWSLWWKAFFWEQKPGILTKRRKKGSSLYTFATKQWAEYILVYITFFCPRGTHLTPIHLPVSCAATLRFVWLQKWSSVSNPDRSGTSGKLHALVFACLLPEGDKLGHVLFFEDLYLKGLMFFMLLNLMSLYQPSIPMWFSTHLHK